MYDKYYELEVSLYLLKDIPLKNSYEKISILLNYSFNSSYYMSKLHENIGFKHYSFSGLYPVEKDKIYKANEIYNILIRSYKKEIINEIIQCLVNLKNESFVVTNTVIKEWPNKQIDFVDSLTPTIAILKDNCRRWEAHSNDMISLKESILHNALVKYKALTNISLNYQYDDIFEDINVKNKFAIIVNYKNIQLLGYKLRAKFKPNKNAQSIANLIVVEGLGAKNSTLGMGFVKPYFANRKDICYVK